jgi:hypothetical protein
VLAHRIELMSVQHGERQKEKPIFDCTHLHGQRLSSGSNLSGPSYLQRMVTLPANGKCHEVGRYMGNDCGLETVAPAQVAGNPAEEGVSNGYVGRPVGRKRRQRLGNGGQVG